MDCPVWGARIVLSGRAVLAFCVADCFWKPSGSLDIGAGKGNGRNNGRDGAVCSTLMKACGKEWE